MEEGNVFDPSILGSIQSLIKQAGANPTSFEGELITQIIQASLQLISQRHDLGQLKLITNAIKEMRYAFQIFNQYKGKPSVSFFGSARTQPEEPDYEAARLFGQIMAEHGWMVMTGGAHGIMKAGLEDIEKDARFGLSIRLPFEPPNPMWTDDPKQITFRYFFIRKLMFLAHSDAIAAFPGGFGTQDEVFEVLTLLQTGKSRIVPLVLIEGKGSQYWEKWWDYVKENLLDRHTISPEDLHLFYIAPSVPKAVQHIQHFYRRYHSSRYVKELLVIRLLQNLSKDQVDQLNDSFSDIIASGKVVASPPLPEEDDYLHLPRIVFHHTRSHFGRLRQFIDKINDFPLG